MLESISGLWKPLKRRQKLALAVSGVLVFAGIWGFRSWMAERAYRPLYSELSAEEAGAAVSRLRELEVPYKLASGGSTVLVPESQLAEARLQLASAGLPRRGRLGFEIFDESSFGATDFAERVNFQRALEGELERSVLSLSEVERARVHISLPKRSVFLDHERPAKASVVVQLRRAAQLGPEQVNAISFLLASAVEDLDPRKVVVVDTAGRILARPKGAGNGQITTEQLDYQAKIETEITRKILDTLEPYVGFDKARASVAVECDWSGGEQTEEVIDPNTVVMTTQKSEEISEPVSEGGLAGTASNLPRQAVRPRAGSVSHSRRMETTNYQASRTVTRTTLERGEIKRMSVAVLVDHKVELDESAGTLVRTPRTEQEMEVIRQLAVAAAGVVEERGDLLTTESLPFTIFDPPPMAPQAEERSVPLFSLEWLNQNRYYLIGAAVFVILAALTVMGLIRLKYRIKRIRADHEAALAAKEAKREIEEAEEAAKRRELEEARMLKGLKMNALQSSKAQVLKKHVEETADKDPEGFVQLLRAWIHEE